MENRTVRVENYCLEMHTLDSFIERSKIESGKGIAICIQSPLEHPEGHYKHINSRDWSSKGLDKNSWGNIIRQTQFNLAKLGMPFCIINECAITSIGTRLYEEDSYMKKFIEENTDPEIALWIPGCVCCISPYRYKQILSKYKCIGVVAPTEHYEKHGYGLYYFTKSNNEYWHYRRDYPEYKLLFVTPELSREFSKGGQDGK
ncbi:MAG: hypothetical protein ACOYT4_03530 [Nanoarchaeota archaeon]